MTAAVATTSLSGGAAWGGGAASDATTAPTAPTVRSAALFYSGVRGLGCRLRLFCGVWRRKVLAAFPHGVCREALVAGLAGLPGCGRVRRLRRPLAAVRGRRALLVGSPAPATSPSPLPCPSGPPLHSPFGAPPFGAPGKLILPPWASGPCWGAAPHRLQLLPSGTYRPRVLLCMRLPRR